MYWLLQKDIVSNLVKIYNKTPHFNYVLVLGKNIFN